MVWIVVAVVAGTAAADQALATALSAAATAAMRSYDAVVGRCCGLTLSSEDCETCLQMYKHTYICILRMLC